MHPGCEPAPGCSSEPAAAAHGAGCNQRPLLSIGHPLVHLTPPFAYPEFLWLLDNSRLIMTDSGGVQEEAPSLGKPVLLLRDTTERPEAMEAGTVIKVASDPEMIYKEAMNLLTNQTAYDAMAMKLNPYGDGQASQRIVESMMGL